MVGPRGLKGQSGCYITWGVNMHVVCMCSRGFGGMVLYALLIATCHIKYNRHVWPNYDARKQEQHDYGRQYACGGARRSNHSRNFADGMHG